MNVAGNRAIRAHIDTRTSAAQELISSSFAAQAELVATTVIPAVAESPIPVLAPRNRTPDPRSRDPRSRSRTR